MPDITGTFLIIGGTKSTRLDKAKDISNIDNLSNSSDISLLELSGTKRSIGIAEIRNLIAFLGEKPYERKTKVVIIDDADFLTMQAQNALLKTLEEAPSYALIILLAQKENSLLKTVISRCKIIRQYDKNEEVVERDLLPTDMNDLLIWAKDVSKEDNNVIIDMLRNQINYLRQTDKLSGKNTINNIKLMLQVIKDLESISINKSLALEYLVLNLELE